MRTGMTRLAAAAAWALAAGAGGAALADEVKLGLIGSLTGPHAGWDLPASDGVHMAVDEINKAGGFTVGGKKYTFALVEEDAQSKPDAAAGGAQKILSDRSVHTVFGILTSTPGMAASNLISRAKVLYIGGFTAMDGLIGKPGNELFFRALNNDEAVAAVFVPAVVKEIGIKKIGVLLPNEDIGKTLITTYKPLFEKAGVEVVATELFQPGTADFAPVLRRLQGKGLDALFIGYSDPDAEAIVRQTLEVGNLPTKFVYRGGSGAPAQKYADKIDAFAWQILTREVDGATDPTVKEWVGRYKAATKKDVTATSYWALTFYDTVFMLRKAMEETGSVTDSKALAAKLKGMRYDGIRGMRYDAEGRARTDVDIGILKGGKTSVVLAKAE